MKGCPHHWANDARRPLLGAFLDGLQGALLACTNCGELWPGEQLPEPDPVSLRAAHEAVTP